MSFKNSEFPFQLKSEVGFSFLIFTAPSGAKSLQLTRHKSPSPVPPSFPASLRYKAAVAATIRGCRRGRASLPPEISVNCRKPGGVFQALENTQGFLRRPGKPGSTSGTDARRYNAERVCRRPIRALSQLVCFHDLPPIGPLPSEREQPVSAL